MSTLARIKDVSFYVGLTADAAACFEMKQFLEANSIPYLLLAYMDDSVHAENFRGMSTWTFGPEGRSETFDKFPILVWKEFDTDFENVLECARTVEDVRNKLLPKASFIKL